MTAPTQRVPDSALVERIMAGEEDALSALYDRYAGMLFAMLVRILKDTSAAEEVLQDLFLQLWRGASRFDAGRGSLPAWLLVIGRNRALSRLRRPERREILEDPEEFSLGIGTVRGRSGGRGGADAIDAEAPRRDGNVAAGAKRSPGVGLF